MSEVGRVLRRMEELVREPIIVIKIPQVKEPPLISERIIPKVKKLPFGVIEIRRLSPSELTPVEFKPTSKLRKS